MTDPTYDDESPRYPEVADRDARLVGHEWKGEAIGDDPKCEAGCISYYGGEKKHHKDCPYYPESLTKLNADRIRALLAEREALKAEAEGAEQRGYALGMEAAADYCDAHTMDIPMKASERVLAGMFIAGEPMGTGSKHHGNGYAAAIRALAEQEGE